MDSDLMGLKFEAAWRIADGVFGALTVAFLAQWILDGAPSESGDARRAQRAHYRDTHTIYLIAPLDPGACQAQDMPEPVGAIRVCMRREENGR